MQVMAATVFITALFGFATHASAVLPPVPPGSHRHEPAQRAQAAPAETAMALLEQSPRPHQVMSGSGIAFALRFDRLVDHGGSRFVLVTPAGAERTIRLRLNAQPNTLYASLGRLAPGDYVLRWQVRGMGGGTLQGEVPFKIAANQPAR